MRSSKLIKKNKIVFLNKELRVKAFTNVLKLLIFSNNKKNRSLCSIYRKKAYMKSDFSFFKPISNAFKGCSIITYRRKGFYSLVQLSRFELKRLTSERMLIGIRSAV